MKLSELSNRNGTVTRFRVFIGEGQKSIRANSREALITAVEDELSGGRGFSVDVDLPSDDDVTRPL